MKRNLLFGLLFLGTKFSFAQQSAFSKMKSKLEIAKVIKPGGIMMEILSPTQASIRFSKNSAINTNDAKAWINKQLELRQGIDMLLEDDHTINTSGLSIKKMYQYYKGIKVEHGVINTTDHNGEVAMMQMEYYAIPDKFNTSPSLNEPQALQKAIDFVGALIYPWDGYTGNDSSLMKPKGELVIVRDYQTNEEVCLAYKFDIYALQPFSKAHVYVNAWNGSVVLNDPIIKHTGSSSNILACNQPTENNTPSATKKINKILVLSSTKKILNINKAVNSQKPLANVNATVATRYAGQQNIITDNGSTVQLGNPYRLRENRYGQDIITLNYNQNPYNTNTNYDVTANDFIDNDNNWTAAEYHNNFFDDAALDVQFSMELVCDYWQTVHGRNGWNDKRGEIKSFVHVTEAQWNSNKVYLGNYFMPNAFWSNGTMHFGDGKGFGGTNSQPYTSLDVCAHEMGHAITETTSGLIYQWESGAINEGFSDIWAACITNYAKTMHTLPLELTWRLAERCENVDSVVKKGFRDMADPMLFHHPACYKDSVWKPASLQTCILSENNDNCGVHYNSGVLNKWFYLITNGENGINYYHKNYSIPPLGFADAQKIAYLTSINLTPNATYQTTRTVSVNATATLFGDPSFELQAVKDAWVAVGLDSNIYNMNNTPVFTTNNFTAIGVGNNGNVWAGTSYGGLYQYDGTSWILKPDLANVKINDIKADKAGGIWIAQSGKQGTIGGGSCIAGGVNYYATSATVSPLSYSVDPTKHVPSRNGRCMYIDTFRMNGTNPKVWVATTSYITSSASTSGMLGQGYNSSSPEFTAVSEGLNIASGTAGCLTVGGDSSQIWTFAQANNGINQLLTYNATTNAFITAYDHNTVPALPSGFKANAIYFDKNHRGWIGLANTGTGSGVMVYDEHKNWHYINTSSLFSTASQVNFNAIIGDPYGDVYIGTNNGIVFFDHGIGEITRIDSPQYYKLYTKANGLPSNIINAIAYDTLRFKLLVATDSGVIFWEPLCLDASCKQYRTKSNTETTTVGSGNWSNPNIWSNQKVPDSTTHVTITDSVTVDIKGECKALSVVSSGYIKVSTGKSLKIFENGRGIILGVDDKQKKLQ